MVSFDSLNIDAVAIPQYDLTMVLAMCLVVGAVALAIMMFVGSKRQIGFWGGFALSAAACGVAIAAQHYAGLLDWIILGATGVSTAASLFVFGMVSMIAVMAWNFVRTNGKHLVR
jgi:hypothetical protein